MGFIWKLLLKVIANGVALYICASFLAGFRLTATPQQFIIAALILTIVHLILGPILRLISFPFIIITLGLFNLIINAILLFVAELLLPTVIHIADAETLLIASVIITITNAII